MSNYNAVIVREDRSLMTFDETTHRWKNIGILDNITPDLVTTSGFEYSHLKAIYDNILLEYALVDTLEDGATIYESETIKPEYGVTALEDTSANGKEYLKATISQFTPYDSVNATDKIYLYSTEENLVPEVEEINFSVNRGNKGTIDNANGIKVTLKINYNYDTKIKVRMKVNDGDYGAWTSPQYPYETFSKIVTSSMLKVGTNDIVFEISTEDGSVTNTYESLGSIELTNEAPILSLISADSNDFKLHFIIHDEDGDAVKYRMTLNNSKVQDYVLKDWTALAPSPIEELFYMESPSIVIGETNIIKIEYIDELGGTGTYTYSFEGKYRNLIFYNENGDILTTDKGEILRYLEFGKLVAGTSSSIKKVTMKNCCNKDVTNLIIKLKMDREMEGVDVYISKTKTPFTKNTELTFGDEIINEEEEREFYIKIETTTKAEGLCKFKITADVDLPI